MTPGDTTRSTPIGSSSQISLRIPWTPKCSRAGNRHGVGTAGTDRLQRVGFPANDWDLPVVDCEVFATWRAVPSYANAHDLIPVLGIVGQLVGEICDRITFPDGQHRSLICRPERACAPHTPATSICSAPVRERPREEPPRDSLARSRSLRSSSAIAMAPKVQKDAADHPPILLDAGTDVPWGSSTKSGQSRQPNNGEQSRVSRHIMVHIAGRRGRSAESDILRQYHRSAHHNRVSYS